jgi:threonine dehydratase
VSVDCGASAVTIADVRAAAARIAPFVLRTPLERSPGLSSRCGQDVWLKLECFQHTGSFKLRGALNALMLLPVEARARGVVTASAGNHGLGVARAAALLGVAATVVVPETASPVKVEALGQSGAELRLIGATYDEAEAAALALAQDRGLAFVSAYNDPAVVAGGGTVALEILEEAPHTGTLLVPAGGGGLIGGIGVAAHGVDPGLNVVGVQSAASPALAAALKAGQLVTVPVLPSLADGLAGNIESGSVTFDLLVQHVAEIIVVEEAEIAAAMRWLLEREHVLVEGSAAVGVAALLDGRLTLDRPTALVLTGRNVSSAVVRDVLGGEPVV